MSARMKLSLINESDMPPRLDDAIRAALCLSFPSDVPVFSRTRSWHGSTPQYSVVLKNQEDVVAHVGVVSRAITVGGRLLRAAGVQNVFVVPRYRGRGFVRRVLTGAMEEAVQREFDCGLLFCVPSLQELYASCGWQSLGVRQVVRIEDGRELPLPEKNITMFYPIRIQALPEGLIHLRGNDW